MLRHRALEALGGAAAKNATPSRATWPAEAHAGVLAQDEAQDRLAILERHVEVRPAGAPRQVEGHEDERRALPAASRVGPLAGQVRRAEAAAQASLEEAEVGPSLRRRARPPRRRRSPPAPRARSAGPAAPGSSGRRRAGCASAAPRSRRPRSPGPGSRPTSARRASRRRRTGRSPASPASARRSAGWAAGREPGGSSDGSGAGAGRSTRGGAPGGHLVVRPAGLHRRRVASGSQPGIASGPAFAMRSHAAPVVAAGLAGGRRRRGSPRRPSLLPSPVRTSVNRPASFSPAQPELQLARTDASPGSQVSSGSKVPQSQQIESPAPYSPWPG